MATEEPKKEAEPKTHDVTRDRKAFYDQIYGGKDTVAKDEQIMEIKEKG